MMDPRYALLTGVIAKIFFPTQIALIFRLEYGHSRNYAYHTAAYDGDMGEGGP
jgi:hypothetical protein